MLGERLPFETHLYTSIGGHTGHSNEGHTQPEYTETRAMMFSLFTTTCIVLKRHLDLLEETYVKSAGPVLGGSDFIESPTS
jgi:hypothetical protein